MDKRDFSIEEGLFLLADLTRRFGALHEVQVENLKKWPLIYLDVKNSQCEYHHESRKLYFTVGPFNNGKPDRLNDQLVFLEKSCKFLLGSDVRIAVRQGEQTLYGSFRQYPLPDAGRDGDTGSVESGQK